jgi:hypothetical protein
MAGYFTQSRVIPGASMQETFAWLPGQDPVVVNAWKTDDDTQTTTSFRSGRHAPDDSAQSFLDTARSDFGKTAYDNGHTFYTRRSHHTPFSFVSLQGRQPYQFWKGPMSWTAVADWDQFGRGIDMSTFIENHPPYNALALNKLGASYIKSANPLKANAGLSQFVGELREGLPSVISAALSGGLKNIPKGVGKDYLGVQFGWLPFINDIRKFAESISKAPRILEQVLNNSGKDLYRKRSSPEIREDFSASKGLPLLYTLTTQSWWDPYIGIVSSQSPSCRIESNSSVTRKTYFVGMFTYLLEEGDDLLSKANVYAQQADSLLGTRFDASTLWELTPWSWMIDWMFDIGDVISNYEQFSRNNLLLKYGYLMSQTRWDINNVLNVNASYSGPTSFSRHVWTIQKERVRSTPFGFGLDPGSFTNQQWAILGALGLSKGPRSL